MPDFNIFRYIGIVLTFPNVEVKFSEALHFTAMNDDINKMYCHPF